VVTVVGAVVLERLLAVGAIALVMGGAAAALIASNALKRLGGLTIAGFGALVALALWAPPAVISGAAIIFAQIAIGVAIAIRLNEDYSSIETRDIDVADAHSELPDQRQ
jgi:hypothetical protein